MPQYLLSLHSVEGEAREPMTDEEMQQFMGAGQRPRARR